LLLEIFVLPGFGIFGLGGGALVFASIVLASLTFVSPHSESQLEELTQSVGMVAIALAGVLVFAMVSRRYLHQAPVFRGVLLTPPQGAERQDLESHEALADYSDLVGKRGVAATNLRPSGKIEIDHRLVDVLAESEPIDRGTQVLVVDAHANRVIVRAVGPA
jgi:membrane-bound ClpP family serine protease